MTKEQVCARIRETGIIPAIRVSSAADAHFAIVAVASGGIPIVEVTMTVPGAIDLIAHLARDHSDIVIGAGTILEVDIAKRCRDAGANFLTAPCFDPGVVDYAVKEGIVVLPGVLTPTEIVGAWKAGADFVKVYPCGHVGGDKYIRSLKRSLPQVPMIAAGGVNQNTAEDLIVAGADALGVGRELIPAEAIRLRQPDRIRELAMRFSGFVQRGRERLHH